MKEQIEYGKKILDELIEDDKFFLMCFELDEGDEWTDEKCWVKSNPLQATSELGMDFLRSECKMALEVPTKQLSFRTKNLNQWLDGDSGEVFISTDDLIKGRLENDFDWNNKEVIIGIDLAQSVDLCGVTMVHYDYTKEEFYVKSWAFVPSDTLMNRSKIEKIDYQMMANNGYCFPCGDRVVSYSYIEDFILNLEKKYGVRIRSVGYDRYNCISTANRLVEKGLDAVEVRQYSTTLGPACKIVRESVYSNKFFYDKNRLFEIQFSNAKAMTDTNNNLYISKKKSNGKIDMIASLLNAICLWNIEITSGRSVYEERDFIII